MYLGVDGVLILLSLFMGEFWLLNTQLAFICSMFIVFASFYGYKNMVQSSQVGLEDLELDEDDKDIIKKTKKLTNPLKSAFSPLRLFSYFVLVICFLWLNRQGYLQIMPFLLGLGILPVSSLFLGFKKSYRQADEKK